MKAFMQGALIGIGIVILGISLAVLLAISINNDNGTDRCKETSTTTAEYRGCIAVEQCRTDFEGNPKLIGSCIADVIISSIQ